MTKPKRSARARTQDEVLAAIGAWLEACPRGDCDRTLTIEVGVNTGSRVVIWMDSCWIPKGPKHVLPDSRPLGKRKYYAEGQTLQGALNKLHVPKTRKRESR